MGEEHPTVVDCMVDIRALCERIGRLWDEEEDAGDAGA